ncbi:MAG: VWA domain-containing protein [Planctomycetes bacterium]|nr:VWA domain-containing protein [Planctomycetota bacterium]
MRRATNDWMWILLPLFCILVSGPTAAQPGKAQAALRDLEKASRDQNTEKFLAALDAGLEGDAVKALPKVLECYGNFDSGRNGLEAGEYYRFHSAVAHRLGRLRRIAEVNEMKRLMKNCPRWQGRLLLLDASLAFGSSRSDRLDMAFEALEDGAPAVIRRALFYLKKVADLKTVDAILSRFLEIDRKEGAYRGDDWDRARFACRDALTALLKISLPAAVDYQNYLSTRRDWPDLFNPARSGEGARTALTLFGTEVTGKNIVFVIDVSGSMMATDPIILTGREEEKHKTEVVRKKKDREKDGGKEKDAAKEEAKVEPSVVTERRRITRARKELVKVIRALPEGVKINIIAYSSDVASWKVKLVPATPETRKEAVAFVETLDADGITVTDRALESAFEDLSVDTIYLITDGAPTHVGSTGPELPPDAKELIEAIHKRIRELNFLRGVRLFTLGFPEAEEEFLKKLAADNSGTYAPIR